MELTPKQQRAIGNTYNRLTKEMSGKEFHSENIAGAMVRAFPGSTEELPDKRKERYVQILNGIMQGYDDFDRLYDEIGRSEEVPNTNQVVRIVVNSKIRGLSAKQRESLCRKLGVNLAETESGEEILDGDREFSELLDRANAVVGEQTGLINTYMASLMKENIQKEVDHVPSKNECILFTAAMYAYTENGTLSRELGASPELLGAGAACCNAILQQDWTAAGNSSRDRAIAMACGIVAGLAVCAFGFGGMFFVNHLLYMDVIGDMLFLLLECTLYITATYGAIIAGAYIHEVENENRIPQQRGYERNREALWETSPEEENVAWLSDAEETQTEDA